MQNSLIYRFNKLQKNIRYFYKVAWKVKPVYFVLCFLNIVSVVISPFISILGIQYLINEVAYEEKRSINNIVVCVLFIVGGNYVMNILKKYTSERENSYNREFERTLAADLNEKTMGIPFAEKENPEVLDSIQKASRALEETGGVQGITNNLTLIIAYSFVLFSTLFFILRCSFILMIPVFISAIAGIKFNSKIVSEREKNYEKMGPFWRTSEYFSSDVLDKRYAKDIRLYPCCGMLLERQKDADTNVCSMEKKLVKATWKFEKMRVLTVEICNLFEYLIIGYKAYNKEINLGELNSMIQYTLQFAGAMQEIVKGYSELEYIITRIDCYADLMETDFSDMANKNNVIDKSDKFTLKFQNVSFRYPGQDSYCIHNVSFVVNEGEHISIVGENGAGKSTLVKLICRLYKPDEGQIMMNGIDIWSYSKEEYMKNLAVVFQDYKLLAFSIRDNITIGRDEEDKKLYCLCKNYGINEWIEGLPQKFDTSLYKVFDASGIEPSGGQAQKLSIVRALYKNCPMVILDEPTAALDPLSEYEVFTHFDLLIEGKTAIYISHRLSSCRFCDRIIVFKNGQICEMGTHEELYSNVDGYYAKLYMTQAQHYK